MTPASTVCLLRAPDDDDAYERCLREAGFDAYSVPVLRFVYVAHEALRHALEHPSSYGGLIVTSPRAVTALADAMAWLPSENVRWHTRPVYAVGPATAAALDEIGFAAEGAASGHASLLADHIIRHGAERPLLFLCGNRRRDDLPDALAAAGVPVEELCVYETHHRDDLDFSNRPAPDWLVFFSPSGLEAVQQARGIPLDAVHRAAIGETTAEAMNTSGWPAHAVATDPTPESLARAIRAAVS